MNLSIGTDRPKQTVQTQIRLVLKSTWHASITQFQASYAVCWQLLFIQFASCQPLLKWWSFDQLQAVILITPDGIFFSTKKY